MSIELVIVTPQGEAYSGPVESVVLPGAEGEFGVLAQHERFLSPLRIGEVEIRTAEGTTYAAIASGFAEVNERQIAVMVESCEIDRDIDSARAELERERAREGLEKLGADEDRERYQRYEEALQLAEARLAVSRRTAQR
jgi:F-type H+-transporting ATPase subunit epsilon